MSTSTTESTSIARTKLIFSWRSRNAKEGYLAICEAVRSGYNTREALLAVLPQFSPNRLVLALETLIASEMAYVNGSYLSVSDDMLIVEKLIAGQALELPIDCEVLKSKRALLDGILSQLGLQNPSKIWGLLNIDIKEAEHAG